MYFLTMAYHWDEDIRNSIQRLRSGRPHNTTKEVGRFDDELLDPSKVKHHWYERWEEDDEWQNFYGKALKGKELPENEFCADHAVAHESRHLGRDEVKQGESGLRLQGDDGKSELDKEAHQNWLPVDLQVRKAKRLA